MIPVNVFFAEDGEMDKRVFLSTWKDIPSQNEVQFTLTNITLTAGNLKFLINGNENNISGNIDLTNLNFFVFRCHSKQDEAK